MENVIVTRTEAVAIFSRSETLSQYTAVVDYNFNSNKQLREIITHIAKLIGNPKKAKQYEKAVKSFVEFANKNQLVEQTEQLISLLEVVKNSNKLSGVYNKIDNVLKGKKAEKEAMVELLINYALLKNQGKGKRKEREELYYKIMEFLAHS